MDPRVNRCGFSKEPRLVAISSIHAMVGQVVQMPAPPFVKSCAPMDDPIQSQPPLPRRSLLSGNYAVEVDNLVPAKDSKHTFRLVSIRDLARTLSSLVCSIPFIHLRFVR